jgi:hypothetical protein
MLEKCEKQEYGKTREEWIIQKKEIITWRGIMDKEINKKGARDIIEYLDS